MLYDFDGLHLHSTGNILMFGVPFRIIFEMNLTTDKNKKCGVYIEKEEAIGGARCG